jgi:N-hydroxyarylamine O-acetyltransferase
MGRLRRPLFATLRRLKGPSQTMVDSVFDPDGLDLDAYLERVGLRGTTGATLATLEALALAHPIAIPFENLDAFLRRPLPLDIAALQRKMVLEKRGGWCFEQNLLFGTALRALGFRPTGLAARVLWNVPEGSVRPRSHMLLLLEINGRRYIADVGFGGLTLTAPLRLEPNVAQATPHEVFRLRDSDGDFVLEALLGDVWRPLYRFDLQPQHLADYEVSNWYLCHFPQSHFLAGIMAARADRGSRHALADLRYTRRTIDGSIATRVLHGADAVRNELRVSFGIELPDGPDVSAALQRLTSPAP